MSIKKMAMLCIEIDRLRDEVQRLTIENDLLRQKINKEEINAQMPTRNQRSRLL